jgi:hypothetical protein
VTVKTSAEELVSSLKVMIMKRFHYALGYLKTDKEAAATRERVNVKVLERKRVDWARLDRKQNLSCKGGG